MLPLHDRANLTLFLLIEEWADWPAVRVVAEPIVEWPQERLEDFRRIRVARSEVGKKYARRRKADDAVREVMGAMVSETEAKMRGETAGE